jgi:hypothetical protein
MIVEILKNIFALGRKIGLPIGSRGPASVLHVAQDVLK